MKLWHFPARSAEAENLKDAILLGLEGLTWVAAWALIPAWLGSRGSPVLAFVAFALLAGTLLAAGVVIDRGHAILDRREMLCFAGLSSLAILLLGGVGYAFGHLLTLMVTS
jgi:hypothetical protein